jgi:hypothetical protein
MNTYRRTGANKGKKFSLLLSPFSLLLLFAFSILFTQTSFAQMKIRLGATAGANFATLYEKDTDYDLKTGFRGGLVADFGLHKAFSIVPEVLFSQKGWKYIGKDAYEGYSQTATVNYVEVPVSLVLKLNFSRSTRVTLFPAFYAAYAITGNAKEVQKDVSTSTGKINFGKGADEMNPLDMGLNLGLGLEVKSVFFRFQLHGGLKNLNNGGKEYTSQNSAVSLSLGYFFIK